MMMLSWVPLLTSNLRPKLFELLTTKNHLIKNKQPNIKLDTILSCKTQVTHLKHLSLWWRG